MDLGSLTKEKVKELCKNAILVQARDTSQFKEKVIYCNLKHPLRIRGYYINHGLCIGITSFSKGRREYEVNINEEIIRNCLLQE